MRIAQQDSTSTEYFLPDALGSVRQLVDETGTVTLAQAFQPYGETLSSAGTGNTAYGYTGEWTDSSGLVHLRARYYAPGIARFMTRDPWDGDAMRPMSYNPWLYVYANPVNLTDPSGWCVGRCNDGTPTDPAPIPTPPLPYCIPYIVSQGLPCMPLPCPGLPQPGTGSGGSGNGGGGPGDPGSPGPDPAELTWGGKLAWEAYQAFRDTPGWWLEPINALALNPVLAIAINYERSDLFDNDTFAKSYEEKFIEAFGRSCWQKCNGNKGQINNGNPSSTLLNFLGLTSFKNHNPSNTPITANNFPRAFTIADRVLFPTGSDSLWMAGWSLDKPAHWGNIISPDNNLPFPPNPVWFVNWVKFARYGLRNDPHIGPGSEQILFSSGGDSAFYIMTPAQATAHCGQARSCVQMTEADGPMPSFVPKYYQPKENKDK